LKKSYEAEVNVAGKDYKWDWRVRASLTIAEVAPDLENDFAA
jgi:hypothetical protein